MISTWYQYIGKFRYMPIAKLEKIIQNISLMADKGPLPKLAHIEV